MRYPPTKNETGFTLLETIIAITIALILTLILARGLVQPQNTATADARAQMLLSEANTFQQTYAQRTGTYYAGPTTGIPTWANINPPATTTLEFVSASASTYCAQAVDENTPHIWSVIPGETAKAVSCAER